MIKEYPLSIEEESAMQALGGFDKVASSAGKILRQHGIERDPFSPEQRQRIHRGRDFVKRQVEFHFDPGNSLRANIQDLLQQADELQQHSGGTAYVGAMLQHLVGAKLDVVIGEGKIQHHGFSVADQSTARQSDFLIESVAIHVTTNPTEALVRKCGENIKAGLKPLIITLGEAVRPAEFILKTFELNDRVDVLDASQFLTANVYERSLFKAAECKVTLAALLARYNAIVEECETDPSLRIKLTG
ncbi:MAG: DUF4928 family protein [Verrucomicrobiota bacterium]|jgi:hypothetical protein